MILLTVFVFEVGFARAGGLATSSSFLFTRGFRVAFLGTAVAAGGSGVLEPAFAAALVVLVVVGIPVAFVRVEALVAVFGGIACIRFRCLMKVEIKGRRLPRGC